MSVPVLSLKTDDQIDPLGLDHPPSLSWRMNASRRGARQSAWSLRAASSPAILAAGGGDLWDSGWIEGADSQRIPYGGSALGARQQAFWTVAIRDECGDTIAAATPARFEMGLPRRQDWSARWISAPWAGTRGESAPCPHLRKPFNLGRPVVSARLYITALGLYEAWINGRRIGDEVLNPGWTDFRKRVRYRTYDVTSLLGSGANVLGVVLGDGWYCGHLEKRQRQLYGERPLLLAQLEIRHPDGATTLVASDGTWRAARGGILAGDLIMGERHDDRLALPGWSTAAFSESAWDAVLVQPDPGIIVEAPRGPMPKEHEIVPAVTGPTRDPGGNWIYDLGQNLAGHVRLDLDHALPVGTTLRLRHGEMLESDGRLHLANLRTAKATDHWTSDGSTPAWQPRFTSHGFRYVELGGIDQPPPRQAVAGVVVHSAMERTGHFSCSDPLLNRLHENIVWGLKGNFLDVPTDCPQRDERLGWMGDAQVFAPTAAYLFDVRGFFAKWLQDVRDAQYADGSVPCLVPNSHLPGTWPDGGPGWSDAIVICAWEVFRASGDTRILSDHWEAMERWMGWLASDAHGHLRGEPHSQVRSFGDWCALDGSPGKQGGTSFQLIGTAYYAHVADLMARSAVVLGRSADAARYADLCQRVVAAFQARFLGADGRLTETPTQTAYTLALRFGLIPVQLRVAALDALEADLRTRGCMSTGFLGTPHLLHVLSDGDRLDTAYALLTRREFPSWLYSVTQGATTIWERWDAWTRETGFQNPEMNSFNHYAFGAVGEWLYRVVAGIAPAEPGYRRIHLEPRPGGGLTEAAASVTTGHGTIESRWKIVGKTWGWNVVVPPNTTATAVLPTTAAAGVREGGKGLDQSQGIAVQARVGNRIRLELQPGSYGFTVPWVA